MSSSSIADQIADSISLPLNSKKEVLEQIANAIFKETTFTETLKQTFASLASPITKSINELSFRSFILSHCSTASDSQIDSIFREFDSENYGLIDFESFTRMFTPFKPASSQKKLDTTSQSNESINSKNKMDIDSQLDSSSQDCIQELMVPTKPEVPLSIPHDSPEKTMASTRSRSTIKNHTGIKAPSSRYSCQYIQPAYQPVSSPELKLVQQPRQNDNYQNKPDAESSSQHEGTQSSSQHPSSSIATIKNINDATTNQKENQSNQNPVFPSRKQERLSITAAQSERIIHDLVNPQLLLNKANKTSQAKGIALTSQYHDIEHDILIRNLHKIRKLNAQDSEAIRKQYESPLSQLLMKLAELKNKHLDGTIDLFQVKKTFPNGRITLLEFEEVLTSYGLTISKAEKSIIQEKFFEKNSFSISTTEFIGLFCLYDSHQIATGNENTEQVRSQKKIISMVKTQICAHYYFEIEKETLPGYLAFCSLFAQVSKDNIPFSDISFPATPDSIIRDSTSSKYIRWREYEWLRPQQFKNGNSYVMFDKIQALQSSRIGLGKLISPYDIQQGNLGDCYFLSALSSLATEPQRILSLFTTQVMNPYGIYCVKICHDGIWTAVFVDDQIPCKKRSPAFTRSCLREIWVCILEKAWAKLFRSYYSIESGFCRESLRDLTGAPTQTIPTREFNEQIPSKNRPFNAQITSILREALGSNLKFVVTAGADEEDIVTESVTDRLGLISLHAYSIIGIKEVVGSNGKSATLLRMRNPWGRKEWTGDWSDSSELWTPKLREDLRIGFHKNHGIFYMSMEDFQRFFSDISICYYHDNFFYESVELPRQYSKRGNLFSQYAKLTVTHPGTYYISVVQKNRRTIGVPSYDYSIARLLVIENSKRKCIAMFQKKDREIFVKCEIDQPGTFWIQAKVFFEKETIAHVNSFVVSVYGTAQTELYRIEKLFLPIQLIPHAFLLTARANKERISFSRAPEFQKCISLNLKDGFGYYYIVNNGTATMHLTIDFENSSGIKLMKPYNIQKCSLVINPKKEIIIPILLSGKGYVYKGSESYSVQ